MSEQVAINVSVIDNASKQMEQLSSNVQRSAGDAQKSFLEFSGQATTASVVLGAALFKLGGDVISAGASLQQSQAAFESLTGSAEEATKMMEFLSETTLKSPLDMPQTIEGSRRLLAYGMSAEKVRDVMPGLIDATSALGIENGRLNKITLAMGQIFNSATVKGQELRQLTEAGIPVYDMLAQAIKSGKIQVDGLSAGMMTLGGATKGQTAANEKASASMGVMNAQIAVMDQNLKKAKSSGKKTGEQIALMEAQLNAKKAAVDKASGAISEYAAANQNAGEKVKFAGKSLEEIKSMLINVGDLQLDGKKSAEALFDAFGEKYAGAAEKQMKTFSAQLSNTRDVFMLTAARMVGWSEDGVKVGSILDILTTALTNFNNAITRFSPILIDLTEKFLANKVAVGIVAGMITALLIPALGFVLGPIAALVEATAPLIVAFGLVGGAVGLLSGDTKKMDAAMDDNGKTMSNWYDGIGKVDEKMKNLGKSVIFVTGKDGEVGGIVDLDAKMSRLANNKELDSRLTEWDKKVKALGDSIRMIDFSAMERAWGKLLGLKVDFSGISKAFADFGIEMVQGFISDFALINNVLVPNFLLGLDLFGQQLKLRAEQFKGIFVNNDLGISQAQSNVDATFAEMTANTDGFILGMQGKESSSSEILKEIYRSRGESLVLQSKNTEEAIKAGTAVMSVDVTKSTQTMSVNTQKEFTAMNSNASLNMSQISTNAKTQSSLAMTNYATGMASKKPEVDKQMSSLQSAANVCFVNISKNAEAEGANTVSGWVNSIKNAASKLSGNLASEFKKTFGLDKMAHGGMISGPLDAPVPIIAHGGERVVPRTGVDVNQPVQGGSGGVTINFNAPVNIDSEDRVNQLAAMIDEAWGRQSELARMGVGY